MNPPESILFDSTLDVAMEDNRWKSLPEGKPKATEDNEEGDPLAESRSNVETHYCQDKESLISVGITSL